MPAKRCTIAVFNQSTGWTLPDRLVVKVRDTAGDDAEVTAASSYAEVLELLPETHWLIGFAATEDQIRASAPKLEWVQLVGSLGDAGSALRSALERGIQVCTAASARAPQIAEHAIAMLLAFTRTFDAAFQSQAEHRWDADALASRVRDLGDANVLVLAHGAVARGIASRLAPFGARCTVVSPDTREPCEDADDHIMLGELESAIPRADAIILALPLIPRTEHLVNKRFLSRVKPGALLIDVGRGGVVDHRALLDALRRGRLAGAGLDVAEGEPLPSSSPFWTMPNVLVTPHLSGASPTYWERTVDHVCANIRALRSGETPRDALNPDWFAPTP